MNKDESLRDVLLAFAALMLLIFVYGLAAALAQ